VGSLSLPFLLLDPFLGLSYPDIFIQGSWSQATVGNLYIYFILLPVFVEGCLVCVWQRHFVNLFISWNAS